MTVLVTGAAGQVGREVLRLAPSVGVEAVGRNRTTLDVTDPESVRRAMAECRPDAVIHAAAYTAVDRAESEPEAAFAVNRDGARHVAAACRQAGVPMVHLSTDYVFDGTQDTPYRPDDPVSPVNVYGASKAAGERAVRDVLDQHVIVRTAWVFSRYDGNFVTTMWRLAGERDRLAVVADQWGHPTAAADVARAALAAAAHARQGLSGTLHAAGSELASWHGLATQALVAADGAVPAVPVDPIPTTDYPTPAARPRRVELVLAPSMERLGLNAFNWKASLHDEAHARFGLSS